MDRPSSDTLATPRLAATLAVCLVLVTAGCVAGGVGTQPTSTNERPTTQAPATTQTTALTAERTDPSLDHLGEGVTCEGVNSVAFWKYTYRDSWSSDVVRIGYYLPPNSSLLFVAYEGESVLGVEAASNTHEDGVHADGDQVRLDRSLSGTHTVYVAVYNDANRNGELDDADTPCLSDGEYVTTSAVTLNFSGL